MRASRRGADDVSIIPAIAWNLRSDTGPRLTREQIRGARLAPLLPLFEQRMHQVVETGGGNFLVPAFPGLRVKDSVLALARAPPKRQRH